MFIATISVHGRPLINLIYHSQPSTLLGTKQGDKILLTLLEVAGDRLQRLLQVEKRAVRFEKDRQHHIHMPYVAVAKRLSTLTLCRQGQYISATHRSQTLPKYRTSIRETHLDASRESYTTRICDSKLIHNMITRLWVSTKNMSVCARKLTT
jgi:hypothetical protein